MTKAEQKVDAWMPLWIGAYLADTMHLSRDEHGGYLLLLMAYWRNRGPLPETGTKLRQIVKATAEEWDQLRPVLVEFFEVIDGHWTHKRADEELANAGGRKVGATSKAKHAAEQRWAIVRAEREARLRAEADAQAEAAHRAEIEDAATGPAPLKQCPEHASSNAQAVPGSCPTPLPTPGSLRSPPPLPPEGVGEGGEGAAAAVTGTAYGLMARALRRAGIGNAHPGHQTLRELVDAGATAEELLAFADKAKGKDDPFAWLLTTAVNERRRAAELRGQLHRGPMPSTAPPATVPSDEAERTAAYLRQQAEAREEANSTQSKAAREAFLQRHQRKATCND